MNIVYQPVRLRLVLLVACGAQFMVVLDSLIVTVALPTMRSALGLSPVGQQWIVTAYLITFGGLMLLAARVADLVGHRRVFVVGLAVFSLASLLGGLATDGWVLLAARALQGAGAATLAPSSLSLLTLTHTEQRDRTHALSIWAATSASAGAVGLVLGGLLTDTLSWRWVLLINVPVGAALLGAAFRILPRIPGHDRARLDLPGAATVTLGLGALVYGISQVTVLGWGSTQVVVALMISAVLLSLFFAVESRVGSPLIPLAVAARRPVVVANLIMAGQGAIMTTTLVVLSLYLQPVTGYGPTQTGLALLPLSLVIVVGSLASKRLMPAVGLRPLLVCGAVVTAVALLWIARFPPAPHYPSQILAPTALWAAGMSVMNVPIATLATADIEPAFAGLASGLLNTARQMGGAVGLPLLTTVAGLITARDPLDPGATTVTHGYGTALTVAAGVAMLTAVLAVLTRPSVS